MPANYTITTRTTGEVLTAAKYNADHQNHIDNSIPTIIDDYSTNTSTMRFQTSPGDVGSESLASSLSGELERLRYKMADEWGHTYWYARPTLINVMAPRYGAKGDGATDDVLAIQAALDYANSIGGATVLFPPGVYYVSAPLNVYRRCVLQGSGALHCYLQATHTGNCLNTVTAGINTTYAIDLCVRDLGFVTTTSSTGGGFVDVGGTNITVQDCYFQGFKYNIILDQSECVKILRNRIELGGKTASIWIANGPDHTASASYGFTNVILIEGNHFNSTSAGIHIQDDGGSNHILRQNNFNAASLAVRACNTSNLFIDNNFFESQDSYSVYLTNLTVTGAVFKYMNFSPVIENNGFSTSSVSAYHIRVDNANGGSISNNLFVGHASKTAAILFNSSIVIHMHIRGNTKAPFSLANSPDIPFLDTTVARLSMNTYDQRLCTYNPGSISAGTRTLTPAGMGFPGTRESVKIGERVLLMNQDGVNPEICIVEARTATTIQVTAASDHAANFLLFGMDDSVAEPTYADAEYGTGTVNNGATSAVITHGLDYIPDASDINITGTITTTNPIGAVYVDTITGTQFTVHVGADPGASTWTFAWRIIKSPYRR